MVFVIEQQSRLDEFCKKNAMKFVNSGYFGPGLTNFVFLATLIDDTTQTDVFKTPLIYVLGNEFCQVQFFTKNEENLQSGHPHEMKFVVSVSYL